MQTPGTGYTGCSNADQAGEDGSEMLPPGSGPPQVHSRTLGARPSPVGPHLPQILQGEGQREETTSLGRCLPATMTGAPDALRTSSWIPSEVARVGLPDLPGGELTRDPPLRGMCPRPSRQAAPQPDTPAQLAPDEQGDRRLFLPSR